MSGVPDVTPTLIVAFTFVAVGGLMIGLMADGGLFGNQDKGYYNYAHGKEIINGEEFTMFLNSSDSDEGYDISDANVLDAYDHDASPPYRLMFHQTGFTHIHMEIIRDSTDYQHSLFNQKGKKGEFKDYVCWDRISGFMNFHWEARSLDQIAKMFDNSTMNNTVAITFTAHLEYVAVFTGAHDLGNGTTTYVQFTQDLYDNNYTVRLGANADSDPHGKTSVWGWIGRMMTLRLPDMPEYLSLIIAVPFWVAIGMVVYSLVKSWWPW